MFELSEGAKEYIKSELKRYEDRYSAIIPSLYKVQEENDGWVSPEAVEVLSEFMDIPESHINEVLEFYTMFNKKPVGKYHIQVCCNLTCSMFQARELTDKLCSELEVKEGEKTKDGRFTVTRVECLGSCDNAPAVQINEKYYDKMNFEKMKNLVRKLR